MSEKIGVIFPDPKQFKDKDGVEQISYSGISEDNCYLTAYLNTSKSGKKYWNIVKGKKIASKKEEPLVEVDPNEIPF